MCLRIIPIALALVVMSACTQTARFAPAPSPESTAHASELYDHLTTNQSEGNLEGAAVNARELINQHPGFPLIDDVVYRAGDIAFDLGRYADAAVHFDRLTESYPQSPRRQFALIGASRAYEQLNDPAKAADRLALLLSSPVDAELRDASMQRLRTIVRTRLSPPQLEALVRRYPDSSINQEVAFDVARREYARGNYDESYRLLGELLYRFPDGAESAEARRLLRLVSERRTAPPPSPGTTVDPATVGILLPVTGQFSLYGRFFEEGVNMALEEFNAAASHPVRVVRADSHGNPISAVSGVRKLVMEDGAIAILGSVFTMPTVAACIEANAWRVPLLSPVVSADDLVDIGPWVFQTKVPLTVEVTAMAELAATRLLLDRYAVVAPSRGSNRELAEFFAREIERYGGEVVALAFYEEGATDFREQLDAVRDAAPDAIFAPGSAEELLLLLPQIKFYDLQVQLLGLSNWNSEKLLRLSRDELEGALFPLQAYHGRDRTAYQRFKIAMEEKGVTDVSPVSVSAYFGMRLLLDVLADGPASREDLRERLQAVLKGGARSRSDEATALTIMTVRSGRAREFRAPEAVDPFN